MKRLIIATLFLLLVHPLFAQTGTVTLAWDANPAGDHVTKYTFYRAAAAAGPWTKVQDVTATTATIAGLTPGIYFFRVTASNVWAESGASNVVSTPPPAGAPANLKVTITVQVTVTPSLRS